MTYQEERLAKLELLYTVLKNDLNEPKKYKFFSYMSDSDDLADWLDQHINSMRREYYYHLEWVGWHKKLSDGGKA